MRTTAWWVVVAGLSLAVGCDDGVGTGEPDGRVDGVDGGLRDASPMDAGASEDAGLPEDAGPSCAGEPDMTIDEGWSLSDLDSAGERATLRFEARVDQADSDALVGVSVGSDVSFPDLAVSVRFSDASRIEARAGDSYTADRAIAYEADRWYRFELEIDVRSRTYTARVGPCDGALAPLLTDGAFRESAMPSELATLALWSSGVGSLAVRNLEWEVSGCVAPVCGEAMCGSVSACGETVECGSCAGGEACVDGACAACEPRSCADAGVTCGSIGDGCGGTVSCGAACPVSPGVCRIETSGGRTVLSRFGLSWTVEGTDHVAGHFVGGDCWIVGPVTVVSTSPASTGASNGSMVNPTTGPSASGQAYEAGAQSYNAALGASFPLELTAGASLVSSQSDPSYSGTPTHPGWLVEHGVLTVVASAASERQFRPAYSGPKRTFMVDDVDLAFLPSVAPAGSSVPTLSELEDETTRPWIDHVHEWVGRTSHALNNMPGYGANMTATLAAACLATTFDVPLSEKRQLALNLIQIGIDFFGLIEAGQYYPPNGGHHSGRLLPILYAGRALGNAEMSAVAARDFPIEHGFAENCQTYGDGLYGIRYCNRGDTSQSYATVNSPTWVGESLCARMVGVEAEWGHPPFFDYVSRWASTRLGNTYDPYDRFSADMWTAYNADY